MLVFITAGVAALSYRLPVALAIVALLAIVVTSYRQTVKAYPRGGGSYIVARENLGTVPGLIAAAAILTDYVLTVAVSITAGTIAITSAAPSLADHKVLIASFLVVLVTAANLRGVKEAGALFALPTYGFVAIVGATIVTGLLQCLSECHVASTANLPVEAETALTLFLLLRQPLARPRSPVSRPSPTACRRSAGPRRRTQPPRSRSWVCSRASCSSASPCSPSSSTSGHGGDRAFALGPLADRRGDLRRRSVVHRPAHLHGGHLTSPRTPRSRTSSTVVDPRARPVHAEPVPQPGRPLGVLERRARPRRPRDLPDLALRRLAH